MIFILLLLVFIFFTYCDTETHYQNHVYLTGKRGEISIIWTTDDSTKENKYFVEYGADPKSFQTKDATSHEYSCNSDGDDYSYKRIVSEVILSDLPFSKTYYRIGWHGSEKRSDLFFFHLYDDTDVKKFTFLIGGDGQGSRYEMILSHLNHTRMESVPFMIFPGDFAFSTSGHEDLWDTYGTISEVLNGYLPVMCAPGNHEDAYRFTSFLNRFSHKIGENSGSNTPLYFSFDYGFVHFITISSEHDFKSGSDQYKWLEKDLQSVDRAKYPIIMAQYHRPMYSSNQAHKSATDVRDAIEHLFKQYKVVFSINGHVHAYERTCEVYGAKCVVKEPDRSKYHFSGEGTIHNYLGTLGRSVATHYDPKPDWSYERFAKYGYSLVEVSNESPHPFISVTFYEVTAVGHEKIADQFTIEFEFCNGKYSYELDYKKCEPKDEMNVSDLFTRAILPNLFIMVCLSVFFAIVSCISCWGLKRHNAVLKRNNLDNLDFEREIAV